MALYWCGVVQTNLNPGGSTHGVVLEFDEEKMEIYLTRRCECCYKFAIINKINTSGTGNIKTKYKKQHDGQKVK